MKKAVMTIICCFVLAVSVCSISQTTVEAKVTNKAMKFLKGTWVTAGNSGGTKVIFTKKYMKFYDLWTSDYRSVKSPKSKGKYVGKAKIISTKKKGKEWTVKVKNEYGTMLYKGYGVGLTCWFKSNGEWMMSGSDSLQRYSKKVYK